jgi:hypothetical protein
MCTNCWKKVSSCGRHCLYSVILILSWSVNCRDHFRFDTLASAHPQMSLKIMGISVSFQFRNEQFCARSRTIPQDSGIGSAAGRPARVRGMDASSQHKGLRGDVPVVRRTSNPED